VEAAKELEGLLRHELAECFKSYQAHRVAHVDETAARMSMGLERFTKLAAQKAELEELDAKHLLAQHEEEVGRMKKELEDAKASTPKTVV